MAMEIPAIIIVLLAPAALAQNVGYDYRMPSASIQLSSNLRSNIQQPYSHAHELRNEFLPVYHQPLAGNVYKNQETQQAFQYNNQGYHGVQSTYQTEKYNRFTPNFGSGNLAGAENVQQASPTRNPSVNNVQPQQPVITKHIYFHLPPPDDSATSALVTQRASKKTYNILFITLPSQKSASAARLQQLVNQQAAADSKTLIYVLVKKSETQPTQPVTSKPEVFFVKYKEPRNVAQPVNSGLVQVQVQAPQSTVGLLPGQINGYVDK